MNKHKKVSINDIAEMLGVSKTLVSIVLNGKGDQLGISKNTQEKVIKLAQELNYKPNPFARGLRVGKSNTLALIVSDISNSFYAKIARYVEEICSKENYNLIICNSDENEEKEKKIIANLLEKQVDGIIISPTSQSTEPFEELNKLKIPFILIDRSYSSFASNYVVVDNFNGAKQATLHLIQNGHKRIACFTSSPAHLSSQVERFLGYKAALEENFISFFGHYYKVIDRNNVYSNIYSVIKEWSLHHIMPTAIFISNNQLTLSFLEVCSDLKIKIPKDLSIVSFDDIDAFKFTTPTITAVSQPIENIAFHAVNELIKQIRQNTKNNEMVYSQIKLETSLVLRQSVIKYA